MGLTEKVLAGRRLTRADGAMLLCLESREDIMLLLARANLIREHFHGSRIDLCAIINAKSGKCTEDCSFCAQSGHHRAAAAAYPLMGKAKITAAAKKARDSGVHRSSIVTSGKGISGKEAFKRLCDTVHDLSCLDGLLPCASLGILTKTQFAGLRLAGPKRYHHNLEAAKSVFPAVYTTHTYDDRVQTVRMAREAGLELCCGGIMGLGETPLQRLELALALRELDVASVPLNFLSPIAGTPLAKQPLMPPLEILKTIALFRCILPDRELRICGGREVNLRSLQPFIYIAGANGVMVGNYLTTKGRDFRTDTQELKDLVFTFSH